MKKIELNDNEYQLAKAFIESAISVLSLNESLDSEIMHTIKRLKIKFDISEEDIQKLDNQLKNI